MPHQFAKSTLSLHWNQLWLEQLQWCSSLKQPRLARTGAFPCQVLLPIQLRLERLWSCQTRVLWGRLLIHPPRRAPIQADRPRLNLRPEVESQNDGCFAKWVCVGFGFQFDSRHRYNSKLAHFRVRIFAIRIHCIPTQETTIRCSMHCQYRKRGESRASHLGPHRPQLESIEHRAFGQC